MQRKIDRTQNLLVPFSTTYITDSTTLVIISLIYWTSPHAAQPKYVHFIAKKMEYKFYKTETTDRHSTDRSDFAAG